MACCSARPWPGSARHESACPFRVGAPLRPVIGRRGRTGPRLRGPAPLSLFWRRRKPPGAAARRQPSHWQAGRSASASCKRSSLAFASRARREADAKAPPVPTAPAVAAWWKSVRSEAPRKLPALPARQLWVIGAKPASAPAAVARCRWRRQRLPPRRRFDAGRRRAGCSRVADRLSASPARSGRRAPSGAPPPGPASADGTRASVGAGAARSDTHPCRFGSTRPARTRSASERVDAACIGAAPSGPAGRRRAHRRLAGAAHGGPVDRHRRLPAPRGHGRRCSGA